MKNVLVTGASTGIGLSVVRRLIKRDDLLVIATSRPSSLPRFEENGIRESNRLWIRPLDVTVPSDRENLVAEIHAAKGGVDVLLNNAGITYRSVVEHVTEEERQHQLAVNFRGPMELTRLVLPDMRRKNAGKIINVSSVGGMMAMPTMGLYSASKFALEGASEALFYEVRPWNIQVTLLQIGFINSEAFLKVPYTALSKTASASMDDPYYRHYCNMTAFIERAMRLAPANPDRVARRIERLIDARRNPLRVRGTVDAHLFHLLRKLTPQQFYHWVLMKGLPGFSSWGKGPQ